MVSTWRTKEGQQHETVLILETLIPTVSAILVITEHYLIKKFTFWLVTSVLQLIVEYFRLWEYTQLCSKTQISNGILIFIFKVCDTYNLTFIILVFFMDLFSSEERNITNKYDKTFHFYSWEWYLREGMCLNWASFLLNGELKMPGLWFFA